MSTDWLAASAWAQGAPPATESPPEQVEVRGDAVRDPVGPKDPNVAGSVLTRERLSGPGLQPQDVLRTQPGVAISESGGFGAPATAAVRGATATETPVYLAGVRLNDDVGGTADLSLVPLWLIDRIEIYRGNAPLEADRLAPGGAIFFEPRRPTRNVGGVGYWGGSWGASKGWAYQGIRAGRVTALAGVSAEHATNRYPFVDDHGELFEPQRATRAYRQNADVSTVDGWGLARVELGGGVTVDVLANGLARDQGVPSLALFPTRAARERAGRELGSVTVRAPLAAHGRGSAVLEARTVVVVGSSVYHDPLLELALYTRDLRIEGRRVEQAVGMAIGVSDTLRIRPLLSFAHEGIERSPDNIALGQARRDFARGALSAEYRVAEWLALDGLASIECHHTGAPSGEVCDVLAPTGRVGVAVGSSSFRVLANVGRYVRVPTLGEVFGVSETIHGNAQLVAESDFGADLGLRVRMARAGAFSGAYVDAFAFARWADDLIAYERTAQGYLTPYNVGSARVLGLELLAGMAMVGAIRAEVAATALDPRDTSPRRTTVNDILPFRSPFVLAPRLRGDWKMPSRSGPSAFGAELRAVYQSSRYVDPAGLGVIPQQTSVDAEVEASWFDGLLTLRGRVADIFDAVRTDIVGYPLPGRSAYLGMETTW
jgi:iron complex outermembrane receptor protein